MYVLKLFGYKKRKMSVNRSLNDCEIKESLNFCDRLTYWWFHNS